MDKDEIFLPSTEKWVEGFNQKYSINTNADVYSFAGGCRARKIQGRINGYRTVSLVQDGFNQNFYVHKLFSEAFLKDYEDGDTIYFKDGNRDNISIDNLSHSGTFNMLPFDSMWIKGYEGLYSINEEHQVVSWVKGYPVCLKGTTLHNLNGEDWKIYSLVKDGVVRTHYLHDIRHK